MTSTNKSEVGITLIALVITIIILIILATITINAVFGQNGLIAKARTAVIRTRQGAVDDEYAVWIANNEAAKHTGTGHESSRDFIARLIANGTIEADETDGATRIEIGERDSDSYRIWSFWRRFTSICQRLWDGFPNPRVRRRVHCDVLLYTCSQWLRPIRCSVGL